MSEEHSKDMKIIKENNEIIKQQLDNQIKERNLEHKRNMEIMENEHKKYILKK